MKKGLFDLSNIESMSESDLLNVNILDEPIMESNSEFEGSQKNEKFPEQNISVPGGLSETPSAKPADGEVGPKPNGGLSESPSSKPYDLSSISVPSGTTLTADEYNDALGMLQKSFKEGYEAMSMLMNATVVQESVEDLQEEYTMKAVFESYIDGPYFEAVTRKDKNFIKDFIKKNKEKIFSELKADNRLATASYDKFGSYLNALFRILVGAGLIAYNSFRPQADTAITGLAFTAGGAIYAVHTFSKTFGIRGWQIIGAVSAGKVGGENDKIIDDAIDKINKKFKDELGGYKIYRSNKIRLAYSNGDNKLTRKLKRLFFGEYGYLLIIDNTEAKDLNKAIDNVNKELAKVEKNKNGAKEKPIKEGTECTECTEDGKSCNCGKDDCPVCNPKKKKEEKE